MSRMKRYMEDAREVSEAAGLAALHDTPRDRLRAITHVFELCGTLANNYHAPHAVAQMLVHRASDSFVTMRRVQRLEVAA
ncbi:MULTISPECIES: hypothetical protein [Streptomyces]|uniref:hypothetical protein n=1 Tax=Streptomyces TaxID=1883 RepID=UPI001E3962C9|nr:MULTISPECIES: hypothetical protein [Streptomyces]UFQ16439.1 hypothetical protein J2N69_16300 [Streptomyces huasconensis]WCL86041.1 hypothetical protein PPN52_16310 [Streptomyces sp. JCM 35825]